MDRPPSFLNTIPMSQGFASRRLAVPPRQQPQQQQHEAAPPLSPRAASYMATPSPPPMSPSPLGSPMSRQSSYRSGSLGLLSTPAIDAENPPPMATEDELVDLGSPGRTPPPPVKDASSQTADLYAAIERLSKRCTEHELRFRSSKASFEHRVFIEYPTILNNLVALDARAEASTTELSKVIKTAKPELEARLRKVLDERSANVETMRARTTPWVSFLPAEDEMVDVQEGELDEKQGSGSTAMIRRESGKIERVKGANASNDDSEALAMIERWAEEVKMKLADEIGRLRTQLGEERRKAHIVTRLMILLFFCGALLALFYSIANGRGKAKV